MCQLDQHERDLTARFTIKGRNKNLLSIIGFLDQSGNDEIKTNEKSFTECTLGCENQKQNAFAKKLKSSLKALPADFTLV